MPNGFYGTKEEWNRMEAPLKEIDTALKEFSRKNKIQFSTNYHNWPERSLTWHNNKIRKLIQIWLNNERLMTFNFWICASYDEGKKRYWKQESLKKNVPFSEINNNLKDLLTEGRDKLNSWGRDDLEAIEP